jgi:hypothetical protein
MNKIKSSRKIPPDNRFAVVFASEQHTGYAEQICDEMAESAKARGTGIAKRSPEYVAAKMREGKAVIALTYRRRMGRLLLHRNLGARHVCGQLRPHRGAPIPQKRPGQTDQGKNL